MAENTQTQGRFLLTEKDFVAVEGPNGEELPSVPKHWDEDLLVPGAKKKSRSRSTSTSGSSQGSGSGSQPDTEPAGNASTEAWVEYAKAKGATEADLIAEDGTTPLTRDELKAKYATPSPS